MNLKEQREAVLAKAMALVDGVKAAGREILTDSEQAQLDGYLKEADELAVKIKKADDSAALVARVQSVKEPEPSGHPDAKGGLTGSWGRKTAAKLAQVADASGLSVKAVLQGTVDVPAAVEIEELPERPRRVLDLVPKVSLDNRSYSYLRQVLRDNNADVVADGAVKPTSVYTFEEQESRARVIAHLSEPFPERYLRDYNDLGDVLDAEMRAGVLEKVEQQLLAGTGVGEQFAGLLTTTGVLAQAYATDVITTLRRARGVLEDSGVPVTGVIVNSQTAQDLDLMREGGATGGFLLDSDGYTRVFGDNIRGAVTSPHIPVGTAVLGDFSKLRLRVRQGVSTLAAMQATVGGVSLFETNQVVLRTEGEFDGEVRQPSAFIIADLTAA